MTPQAERQLRELGAPVVRSAKAIQDLGREFASLRATPEERVMSGTTLYLGEQMLVLNIKDERTGELAEFRCFVYQDVVSKGYILAMAYGDVSKSVLTTRVHSCCVTSETLGARDCDCVQQLEAALERIVKVGDGIFFFLYGASHEGRGASYLCKARDRALVQYSSETINTYDIYGVLGLKADHRSFRCVADVVHLMGINPEWCVLTNNPDKLKAFREHGLPIKRSETIESRPTRFNIAYLRSKRVYGHSLAQATDERSVYDKVGIKLCKPMTPRVVEGVPRFVHMASYLLPIGAVDGWLLLPADQVATLRAAGVRMLSERPLRGRVWVQADVATLPAEDAADFNEEAARAAGASDEDVARSLLLSAAGEVMDLAVYWFQINTYYDIVASEEFVVLEYGDPGADLSLGQKPPTEQLAGGGPSTPLVRFHSESVFNRFPLVKSGYKDRYRQSVRAIVEHGWGLVTLFFHDGRGRGLGGVLVDGAVKGVVSDTRDFAAACWVLQRHLRGASSVRVLASAPHPAISGALQQFGVDVAEWVVVGDPSHDRGHSLLRSRTAAVPRFLRKTLELDVPAFPAAAAAAAAASSAASAPDVADVWSAADVVPPLDGRAYAPSVDPSNAEWIITGTGSSEAHGRYLASLLHRHTASAARFCPLTAFLDADHGASGGAAASARDRDGPAPRALSTLDSDAALSASSRPRILVVISQGMSPNSFAALRHMNAFDRVVLFTSVGEAGKAHKAARIAAVAAHPGGGVTVRFPLEDEYRILVRVVGPACGFLRVYQCVRSWCAPGLADPTIAVDAAAESARTPAPAAVLETLIASARAMSSGLLRRTHAAGAASADAMPSPAAASPGRGSPSLDTPADDAPAADDIPARAAPLREVALVASPPVCDYLLNACKKFEEGMLLCSASVCDYLSFPHGKQQLMLLSHRRDPVHAERAQADGVVILLDSGRAADRRMASLAESMVGGDLPVWHLTSSLPLDLQIIEFEAALNGAMLEVVLRGGVDQVHWPGHDGESPLYHVSR